MNKLKEARLNAGYTLTTVAQKMNISHSAISLYENGHRSVDASLLNQFADLYNVSVDYLLGRSTSENKITPTKTIPVLGKIPAGIPVEAIEYVIDEIDLTPSLSNDNYDYFALMVTGNSMYPKYLDGDTIIVRKQPTADSGQDVVAFVNGYDATLKQLEIHQKGIRLKALNPEYESKFFTNEEIEKLPVTILGRVVELRRNCK